MIVSRTGLGFAIYRIYSYTKGLLFEEPAHLSEVQCVWTPRVQDLCLLPKLRGEGD